MYKTLFKTLILPTLAASTFMVSSPASAQQQDTILPELPAPLQNLQSEGAQIRFLGKDFGVDGWIAIKNGQEQYFYVLPNNGGFITGILFDEKGQAVTVEQVNRLREQTDGPLLDLLTSDLPQSTPTEEKDVTKYEFKTPSEQLFWDIENSNWVAIGKAGAPVFYSFIDPQCPHCHAMMSGLKPRIEAGEVQVRIIPVGFKEETRAQAAFLMATPGPEKVWWKHIEGDKDALPAKRGINEQGVQRNLSVMQSWKLSVTPLAIYRGKDGKVKIIRGKPQNLNNLISDLGARD